ncbi:MAG TPA: hypothetical protein VKR06_32565 [Ktedonosporobacter sp.]|nr:hypothetical protein [Ktedonosporobacter sp.]
MAKPTRQQMEARDNMKTWDSIIKRLVQYNPQAFLVLFLPTAIFLRFLPEGLEPIKKPGKKREEAQHVDILMVALLNGVEVIVHIELQTRNDYEMDERLLEYNRKIEDKHGQTPQPCAFYLLTDGNVPASPLVRHIDGRLVLYFEFLSVEVGTWDAEEILARETIEFLPLLPLCQNGRNLDLVDKMLTRLEREDDGILLDLGAVFAEFAFDHYGGDLEWLYGRIKNMRDIEDLPLLKGMLEKGREQGLQEGREEERKKRLKQELTLWRRAVLMLTQGRFPSLVPVAKEQLSKIKDPTVLQDLNVKVGLATTEQEAQEALLHWQPTSKKSA